VEVLIVNPAVELKAVEEKGPSVRIFTMGFAGPALVQKGVPG
jgi:hypothetical protein